jgi:hypothetical protein
VTVSKRVSKRAQQLGVTIEAQKTELTAVIERIARASVTLDTEQHRHEASPPRLLRGPGGLRMPQVRSLLNNRDRDCRDCRQLEKLCVRRAELEHSIARLHREVSEWELKPRRPGNPDSTRQKHLNLARVASAVHAAGPSTAPIRERLQANGTPLDDTTIRKHRNKIGR